MLLLVVVPDGLCAGDEFIVTAGGCQFHVCVPAGCSSGSDIHVDLPVEPSGAADGAGEEGALDGGGEEGTLVVVSGVCVPCVRDDSSTRSSDGVCLVCESCVR